MTNMVIADIYRSVKHIAVYVAVGLLLIIIGISIYVVSPGRMGFAISDSSSDALIENSELTAGQLTDISRVREFMKSQDGYKLDRDMLSTNVNLYYIFIFIVAVVIAVDFTAGCAKNTLTSAISRGKYFISKVFTTVLICLVLYFANTYIIYFANVIFNGNNLASGLWEVTKITLIQLPAILALISILIGIAFIVKKTAIYNLVTIPLLMVFQLIFGYASVLLHIPEKVSDYIPDAMFMILANDPGKEYIITSYIVCVIVAGVFLSAGYLTFKRSEIK